MKKIICITENNISHSNIANFWKRFFAQDITSKIPNKVYPGAIYGIYYNYTNTKSLLHCTYSLAIGQEVSTFDKIPVGMTDLTIPNATYEEFIAKGKMPSALISTWEQIWNTPLKRTFNYDYEVHYIDEYNSKTNIGEVEVYVAVKEYNL